MSWISFNLPLEYWKLLSAKLMDDSRYSKQHIRVFRPHEEDEEYIWKEME